MAEAEEKAASTDAVTDEEAPDTPEADTPAEKVSAEAFAELKSKYNHMLKVFKEKETRERKQQETTLAKKGEYEKLYGDAVKELDVLRPQAERMAAIVQAMLDAELQGLPKGFDRTLIPPGAVDVQLEWILKAKKAKLFGNGTTEDDGHVKRPGDGTPPQRGSAQESFLSIYKTQR